MDRSAKPAKVINEYGALIAFGMAIIFFSFFARNFFSLHNLENILIQSTSLGICAFGLTWVLMAGEIDLSYGGIIGLIGAVSATMLKAGYAPEVVFLACLSVGIISGALNAILVVGFNLSSFLSSVSIMFICMGVERIISQGITIWIKDPNVLWLVQGRIGFLPVPILLLFLLFGGCWFFQAQTRLGQIIRALGEGFDAVKEVGLRALLIKSSVFIIAGLFFALSGYVETLRNGGSVMYAGKQLLLFVLAACYLGTAIFKSGKANFPGTIIGSFFLYTLLSGFTAMGLKYYLVPVAQGLILIGAVTIPSIKRKSVEQVQL